jgi:hypothetical protein
MKNPVAAHRAVMNDIGFKDSRTRMVPPCGDPRIFFLWREDEPAAKIAQAALRQSERSCDHDADRQRVVMIPTGAKKAEAKKKPHSHK